MPTLSASAAGWPFRPLSVSLIAVVVSEFYKLQTQTWARLRTHAHPPFPLYYISCCLAGGCSANICCAAGPSAGLRFLFHSRSQCFISSDSRFPSSHHIEWPDRARPQRVGKSVRLGARQHSDDRTFALDPDYMHSTRRGLLWFPRITQNEACSPTMTKDASAVAVFPDLAWQWNLEVTDRENWQQFTLADFERLKKKYGVTWVIVVRPGVSGLSCPYANSEVMVCRIP